MDAVVGRQATVIVGIGGKNDPGTVLVSIHGGTETYTAYCDTPLDRNARCVIVDAFPLRSVAVEPL